MGLLAPAIATELSIVSGFVFTKISLEKVQLPALQGQMKVFETPPLKLPCKAFYTALCTVGLKNDYGHYNQSSFVNPTVRADGTYLATVAKCHIIDTHSSRRGENAVV